MAFIERSEYVNLDDNIGTSLMSTKFTRMAMVGPPPPPITVLLQTASQWFMLALQQRLKSAGYTEISPSHLMLLGNLDCGTTYAAAVAHRMGVSRQAIFKTLRELQAMGILDLEVDPHKGNQRRVVMTPLCVQLVTEARTALTEFEVILSNRIGPDLWRHLRLALEASWGDVP